MTCEHITLPNGVSAIVCGTRRTKQRCKCGRAATLLCDWILPNGERPGAKRSKTCDAALCPRCSTSPAPAKDLCLRHARAFEAWKEARGRNQENAEHG